MRIGFVGAGRMGHGMVANLLKAGHQVTVIAHRNRQPIEDLVGKGAREAKSLPELARASEMVILCVDRSSTVEKIIEEMLPSLAEGSIVLDTGTSDPASTRDLAHRLQQRGIAYAEAPMTGGPEQAASAEIGAMVGASMETFGRIEPVLRAYCTRIQHFGPPGAGHSAKLVNNYMVLGMVALIADTYVVARRAGIDWAKLYDVMLCGSNNSGALRKMVGPAVTGNYDGYPFTLTNAVKDLGYYLDFARQLNAVSPLAEEVMAPYEKALADGHGAYLISRLIDPTIFKDPTP